MADEGEVAAGRAAVARQVEALDLGLARVERDEPREQAQQRRLARAVGPGEEQDLPGRDVEVGTRERREPAEQAHGGAESDDERHVSLRDPRAGCDQPEKCTDPAPRGSNPGRPPAGPTCTGSGGCAAYAPEMRRIIGGIGRGLVTIGILILLFVGYQLWGTGIYEAREQNRLKAEFARELAEAKAKERRDATPTTTVPPTPPPDGQAVGIIQIPKIGVERAIVQGTSVQDLRMGPGHYPGTPLPGQLGNAAIAGHRTTYGAPFNRIDELAVGDEIVIATTFGAFHYTVSQPPFPVSPKEVSVLDPTPNASLTLTTCHPKYSANQRLIVKAVLDKSKSPKPAKPAPQPVVSRANLDDALSGRGETKLPTAWWGLALLAVGGLWWLVFHRYHRWTTWFMGVLPFAIVLFGFYYHLERLLPANY